MVKGIEREGAANGTAEAMTTHKKENNEGVVGSRVRDCCVANRSDRWGKGEI